MIRQGSPFLNTVTWLRAGGSKGAGSRLSNTWRCLMAGFPPYRPPCFCSLPCSLFSGLGHFFLGQDATGMFASQDGVPRFKLRFHSQFQLAAWLWGLCLCHPGGRLGLSSNLLGFGPVFGEQTRNESALSLSVPLPPPSS